MRHAERGDAVTDKEAVLAWLDILCDDRNSLRDYAKRCVEQHDGLVAALRKVRCVVYSQDGAIEAIRLAKQALAAVEADHV